MISSLTMMKSFLIWFTLSPIFYMGILLVILISLYHIALHIYYLWIFYRCPICIEEYKFTDSVCILSCGHRYHRRCILKWLQYNRQCCICRARIGRRSYSAIHAAGYWSRIKNWSPFLSSYTRYTMATLQRVNELDRQIRDPTNNGDPIAKIIALLILNRVRKTFTEHRPTRVVPIQAPAEPSIGPE